MACRLVGWPADATRLELDHERFAYAGKFVMTRTGKAVIEDEGRVIGAVSFGPDRTDDRRWWLRVVTVRRDRQGEGLGSRLMDFAAERVLERAEEVRIAVNNPYAYEAAYRAGFGFTGEATGLAELVLARPDGRSVEPYLDGLDRFAGREDLTTEQRAFLADRDRSTVPQLAGRDR